MFVCTAAWVLVCIHRKGGGSSIRLGLGLWPGDEEVLRSGSWTLPHNVLSETAGRVNPRSIQTPADSAGINTMNHTYQHHNLLTPGLCALRRHCPKPLWRGVTKARSEDGLGLKMRFRGHSVDGQGKRVQDVWFGPAARIPPKGNIL